MFRGLSVALTDAMNAWLAPQPRPQPIIFIGHRTGAPYVHDGVGRVYTYTIPSAAGNAFFTETCRADLHGYDATWSALRNALDTWIREHGPPSEGTVVLRSSTWTGQFTVAENTDADHILILRLSAPADTVICESPLILGPEMR